MSPKTPLFTVGDEVVKIHVLERPMVEKHRILVYSFVHVSWTVSRTVYRPCAFVIDNPWRANYKFQLGGM